MVRVTSLLIVAASVYVYVCMYILTNQTAVQYLRIRPNTEHCMWNCDCCLMITPQNRILMGM